jgi:hypothetical protein
MNVETLSGFANELKTSDGQFMTETFQKNDSLLRNGNYPLTEKERVVPS